jgi:hypothetical protein
MSNEPTVRALALGCVALGCLAACNWSPFNGGLHSVAHVHSASARSAALPGAQQQLDMVTAVSAGKSALPVDVKFALQQRPEVGQSIKLDVQVTPSAQLDRLITSFHAEDGLTLGDGAQATEHDRPDPGVPIVHTLTLVAKQDGVFYVNATVQADWGTESVAHTYTIPVIAGAGAQ